MTHAQVEQTLLQHELNRLSVTFSSRLIRPAPPDLCNGWVRQSIVTRVSPGVPWRHVMSWLFFGDITAWSGDENAPPPPMYTRRAATHGTRLDPVTSKLVEVKARGTRDAEEGGRSASWEEAPHRSCERVQGCKLPWDADVRGFVCGLCTERVSPAVGTTKGFPRCARSDCPIACIG